MVETSLMQNSRCALARLRPCARRFARCFRYGVFVAGFVLLVTLISCFTALPMKAYQWLGRWGGANSTEPPRYILVLGGGGIPSESGLMRTYHAAQRALDFPSAQVIVSLPADGDPETDDVGRMKRELVLRGIAADRILLEYQAKNTHAQALALRDMLAGEGLDIPVMVVTSEFHIRRSMACLKKAGFTHISAAPARDKGIQADLGQWTVFRYNFWGNLDCLLRFSREITAMSWYRLRGWM